MSAVVANTDTPAASSELANAHRVLPRRYLPGSVAPRPAAGAVGRSLVPCSGASGQGVCSSTVGPDPVASARAAACRHAMLSLSLRRLCRLPGRPGPDGVSCPGDFSRSLACSDGVQTPVSAERPPPPLDVLRGQLQSRLSRVPARPDDAAVPCTISPLCMCTTPAPLPVMSSW